MGADWRVTNTALQLALLQKHMPQLLIWIMIYDDWSLSKHLEAAAHEFEWNICSARKVKEEERKNGERKRERERRSILL